MDHSETRLFEPDNFPSPAGSRWEQTEMGRWRLARFEEKWRNAVRHTTALRSLEVGVSTWQFLADSPFLGWDGRWASRRVEMRELEVAVDGRVVTRQQLEDTGQNDGRLWLYEDAGTGRHRVEIYFPPTTQLEVARITIQPGATLTPLVPGMRWCSWGDSITQGTLCPSARQSYVQLAARELGWTAINRGFGGAGCPDPMTALAIAETAPWDILTIAIGINSAALGLVEPDEFGQMYALCLKLICQRCPGKPVVCISPILCTRELTDVGVPVARRTEVIREVIAGVVTHNRRPTVHYVDGLELLDDERLLADHVHPGPQGHAEMAARLAPLLARLAKN